MLKRKTDHNNKLRSLTYSLDCLIPGVYFWCGDIIIQFGGERIDDDPEYQFVVPTEVGFGFVLPNYFSWHTPFDTFKLIGSVKQKRRAVTPKGFGSVCDAR